MAKPANLNQALDLAKKQGFTLYGAACALPPASHQTGTTANSTGNSTGNSPASPTASPPRGPEHIDAFAGPSPALRLPALLVLGGEEAGLRPSVSRRCDYLISIAMLRDFDSLNVAQAGGILISCFLRQTLRKR